MRPQKTPCRALPRRRIFVFGRFPARFPRILHMNISRTEQRVLHLLAQGGRIVIEKDDDNRIAEIVCLTRDGWQYPGVDRELLRKLKRKKAVASFDGGPYASRGAASNSSARGPTTASGELPGRRRPVRHARPMPAAARCGTTGRWRTGSTDRRTTDRRGPW